MSRHKWLRPNQGVSSLDEMWSNAETGLGANNYFIYNVTGLIDGVMGTSYVVLSNLEQEKAVLQTPKSMKVEGEQAGDLSTVLVTGIDQNKRFAEKLYTLDGTNPIAADDWFRLFRVEYATGPALVGGAFIYDADAVSKALDEPTTFVYAPATLDGVSAQRSLDSSFAVPEGYEAYVSGFNFFADKNVEYSLIVQARDTSDPGAPWQTILTPRLSGASLEYKFNWRRIPELYEVRVLAKRLSGSQNAAATIDYQALMVRKERFDAANQ